MDICALVGDGPSIQDFTNKHLLYHHRYVAAIQGAIRYTFQPDAWIVYDHIALRVFSEERKRFRGEEVLYGGLPEVWPFVKMGGSMMYAFQWALKRFRKIELYGVDLYNTHKSDVQRIEYLMGLDEVKARNVEVITCCPSSHYKGFPIEVRPWTQVDCEQMPLVLDLE